MSEVLAERGGLLGEFERYHHMNIDEFIASPVAGDCRLLKRLYTFIEKWTP
jgi:hypothetical protein